MVAQRDQRIFHNAGSERRKGKGIPPLDPEEISERVIRFTLKHVEQILALSTLKEDP